MGEPYAVVRMGLRAPRIAVVFDADHADWSFLVRRAAFLSCQRWGGAGFALVPHRSGVVDPVALRACAAYDPDHVLAMPWRVGDLQMPKQATAGGNDFIEIESPDDQSVGATAEDELAREQAFAVCSSYRRPLELSDFDRGWDEVHIWLDEHSPAQESLPGNGAPAALACPPSWGGLLGAAAAGWVGAVERPVRAVGEVVLDEDPLAACAVWLLGGRGDDLPRELIHFFNGVHTGALTSELPGAHDGTLTGLSVIHQGHDRRVPWLVVLGDQPEDFALARSWKLIHGNGYWLPYKLAEPGSTAEARVQLQLSTLVNHAGRMGAPLVFTSTSRPAEDLAGEAARLIPSQPNTTRQRRSRQAEVCLPEDLDWRQRRRVHFGVTGQFESSYPVPVSTTATGTRTMMAPLPAPLLTDPALAVLDLPIHVDIAWDGPPSVVGKGILGHHLRSPATDEWLTWIRSSRAGTSFQAQRFDMVFPGMQAEARTARPCLRDLGLRDWVEAICADNDLTVRTSPAGHHGAHLTRMLGSRTAFVDLFSGPLLAAMRAMRPTATSTPDAYPVRDNVCDGIRIGNLRGCLTFDGVHNLTLELSPEQTRDLLDSALDADVLRRGHVLQCSVCNRTQFIQVDHLGQRWTCQRCESVNSLNHAAWIPRTNEPIWFYDLHPVGHNLLANNGEVPALLSAHLRNEGRLCDIDEIEILRAGVAEVELDLVAHINNDLIVAECKSTGNLGVDGRRSNLREIYKKCRAAKILRADLLIFATSASQWQEKTVDWIREAVGQFDFGSLGPPRVQLVENLDCSIQRRLEDQAQTPRTIHLR
ncbi:hypothetical protein ACTG9Q_28660 [Actinokineospora sp. 24-640]